MTARLSEVIPAWLGWCPNARAFPAARQKRMMTEATGSGSPGDGNGGGAADWIGRHGQAAVAITASLCLIALTAVLKNVLFVPAAQLNQEMVLYIIIYLGFIMSFMSVKDQANPTMPGRWPLVWCIVVVIVTLAIVVVYAL